MVCCWDVGGVNHDVFEAGGDGVLVFPAVQVVTNRFGLPAPDLSPDLHPNRHRRHPRGNHDDRRKVASCTDYQKCLVRGTASVPADLPPYYQARGF